MIRGCPRTLGWDGQRKGGGREGEREGRRKREGGRERERERGREGGRKREREGGREGGREREGGRGKEASLSNLHIQWDWSHEELDTRDMSGMSQGFLGLLNGMDSGIGALCSGILGTSLGYAWEGQLDTQEYAPTQSESAMYAQLYPMKWDYGIPRNCDGKPGHECSTHLKPWYRDPGFPAPASLY